MFMKRRGGTILYLAHREFELLTIDRATLHYKEIVASRYAELVYDGVWFSPLREGAGRVCKRNTAYGNRYRADETV